MSRFLSLEVMIKLLIQVTEGRFGIGNTVKASNAGK